MSIPQIVGTFSGQSPSDGSASIEATLPAGAGSYIALAWPGENHVLTIPSGWTREAYWIDGLAAAPVNLYYAEGTPGTTWHWSDYADPGDPEGWDWNPTITLLVIGLDRPLTNAWASPELWSLSFQNTLTSSSGSFGSDCLGLSVLAMFTVGAGDPTPAVPGGSWSSVQVVEAGPDDATAVGGGTNARWDLAVAEQDASGGSVSSLAWTLADGSVSFGTDAGSAAVTLALFGAEVATVSAAGALALSGSAEAAVTGAPVEVSAAGVLTLGGAGVTPFTSSFCTAASPNGRYFVDQDGAPFFWRMECNWFIAARDPSVWASYLSTRQAQGYTVIEVADVPSNPTSLDPLTFEDTDDGIPLFDAADGNPADFNQAWLDRLREFADAAASYGMTVLVSFAYSWPSAFPSLAASDFADMLLATFAGAPNIVWSTGVDYQSSDWPTYNPFVLGVYSRFDAQGDVRPRTISNMPWGKAADPAASGLSTDNTDFVGVVDFEFGYAYAAPYDMLQRGWLQGRGPVVLGESNFEAENNEGGPATTDETLRRQAGWTMTSGGVGWDYGHADVWRPNPGWELVLSTTAQGQLSAIQDAFEAVAWWRLRPDTSGAFLTSGAGVKPTSGSLDYSLVDPLESDYATAAYATDGSLAVVYTPTSRAITVDVELLGSDRSAYRVDPTDGTVVPLSVQSSYTDPGLNAAGDSDWLYVFEATTSRTALGVLFVDGEAGTDQSTSRTATGALVLSGTADPLAWGSTVVTVAHGVLSLSLVVESQAPASVLARGVLSLSLSLGVGVPGGLGNVLVVRGPVVKVGSVVDVGMPFRLLSGEVPTSLLKLGGTFRTVLEPSPAEIGAAERVYLGGRRYALTDVEVAELVDAGYGDWIVS